MTDARWDPARRPADYRPRSHARRARPSGAAKWGGAAGNERLTAMTGTVLLVLLAAEGFTILGVGRMLTLHFFLGMLLLGPVALKAGSTIYRFTRYYTGSAPYRRKGPPELALRVLGPLVMASTAGVFGSGVALAIAGPGPGPWQFLHKGSFVVWFCVMTVHVLAYLPRLPRLLAAEIRGTATPEPPAAEHRPQGYGPRPGYGLPPGSGPPPAYGPPPGYGPPGSYTARAAAVLGGRGVRLTLLIASLLAGLVIAMLTVHLATPWHQPFLHK